MEGVYTAKIVLFHQGSTELRRCENCVFFLPVNILMGATHRLLGPHDTLPCVLIIVHVATNGHPHAQEWSKPAESNSHWAIGMQQLVYTEDITSCISNRRNARLILNRKKIPVCSRYTYINKHERLVANILPVQ